MRFFRYDGLLPEEGDAQSNRRMMRELLKNRAFGIGAFLRPIREDAFIFVSDINEDSVAVGAFFQTDADVEQMIRAYLDTIGFAVQSERLEEITLGAMKGMLETASHNRFIDDDEIILGQYELVRLNPRMGRGIHFKETMIEPTEKETIFKEAQRYLSNETLLPELERIYAGRTDSAAAGHPVHYMIRTNADKTQEALSRLLLEALHANGRLISRRYCTIQVSVGNDLLVSAYHALYKSCIGGAVVVRFSTREDLEDQYASASRELIKILCEAAKQYRNRVLTVFCLEREFTTAKAIFYEELGTVSLVELSEELVSAERAIAHLRMLAEESGVCADDDLLGRIEFEKGYLAPELQELFDDWYNEKLKTDIYPQYRTIASVKQEVRTEKPKGSAYDELMEMIGLTEAKKVIRQALDYQKAQKLFAEKGLLADRPAMHMVFTGNPGTAKTSVARLFARIMRENDLLPKGNLIELGRGDLVGKYVGWTAPTVQKKFREAKGGVLFIDEAYSLVDDRSGSYGDEAINTIVQEMENLRSEVVVIFAGYPDKMQQFLNKNPGLSSRIAFHVPFEDYSTDELCAIADLIAKQKGIVLSEEAKKKLKVGLAWARTVPDFGNGRYVRNVIEKAKMVQASRLVTMDYDTVTPADVALLTEADIEFCGMERVQPKKQMIGF